MIRLSFPSIVCCVCLGLARRTRKEAATWNVDVGASRLTEEIFHEAQSGSRSLANENVLQTLASLLAIPHQNHAFAFSARTTVPAHSSAKVRKLARENVGDRPRVKESRSVSRGAVAMDAMVDVDSTSVDESSAVEDNTSEEPSDVETEASKETSSQPARSEVLVARDELMEFLRPLRMGFSLSRDERRDADARIETFVKNFGKSPEAEMGVLSGCWQLLYSNAPDITTLGSGPLEEVDFIGQEYDEVDRTCENIIRYRPSDQVQQLARGLGQDIAGDTLEQRVLLSWEKKPSAQFPNRVEQKVEGIKVIPRRLLGGLITDGSAPALGGKGVLAVPFGSYDILYNDGILRVSKTINGFYGVNTKIACDTQDNSKVYAPPSDLVAGKTILITGANTGLGLESAKRLAQAGARVVLTARTADKASEARASVKAVAPDADIYSLELDLASLESIKQFPAAYDAAVTAPLDVLLANAGVMAIPERRTTTDGFERQVGVNHLGHFALVSGMLPALKKATDGFRIISVSSSAHRVANEQSIKDALDSKLDPDYSQWGNYGLSKGANVLFAKELQRRFDAAGIRASAVSLHPGVVNTDLARYFTQDVASAEAGVKEQSDATNPIESIRDNLLDAANDAASVFLKTPERGANTHVFLSSAADSDGDLTQGSDLYFEDMRPASPAAFTNNEELARRLWDVSEELTGTKIEI